MQNIPGQKNKTLRIIQAILLVILGIWLLSSPSVVMVTIIRIIGGFMLLSSAVIFFLSIPNEPSPLRNVHLASAVVNLALGLVFLISPHLIVSFFAIIIGLLLLLGGMIGATSAYRTYRKLLTLAVIRNVLLIIIGLLMLIGPFESASAIAILLGISSIIYGMVIMMR